MHYRRRLNTAGLRIGDKSWYLLKSIAAVTGDRLAAADIQIVAVPDNFSSILLIFFRAGGLFTVNGNFTTEAPAKTSAGVSARRRCWNRRLLLLRRS